MNRILTCLPVLAGLFFAVAAAFAVTSPAHAEPPILIRDVQLLDFADTEPRVRPGMAVLVRNGRIAEVGPAEAITYPVNTRVVEGQGRTLLPGLTDMHVHIWDEAELGAYLANGVTTVRNLSGMPLHFDLQRRIAAGELTGPRILTSGPILNSPGPNAQLNHQIVETVEEARDAVREQHAAGYRRIKVYSNLNREAYEAIRSEAARLDMALTGHTPEGPRAPGIPAERPFLIGFDELLDDDFESIEHVESIVWHGLRDRRDPEAGRALARRIAEARVAVDPTLIAFANLARVAETGGAHLDRPGTETLNPFIRQMETAQSERWSNEDADRAMAQLDFYKAFTGMLAEEGVPLVAGSDAGIATNVPGISLHDELDLLVEAGLTPAAALRTATTTAAEVLGESDTAGRIAPGHRADLLLVEGDPLADLTVLRHPAAVIADGRLFEEAELAALWASASDTNPERTQRNAFEALQAQGTAVPGE